ncbi:BamA/TamA family outer membrane protein [Flavobacterium sp. AG291]|uniref:BamA/TamA family outer membrane protein n=1 Tax=Flavobacterium sp. AG291 TaxID=2184000 RepID=UPI000E2BE1C1|nr:BamA/TamA family outer membrane protein [Flavobacterium sp. AG291]RDI06922.1 surface antigen-like protein [Flavobacterium sp. AG291]
MKKITTVLLLLFCLFSAHSQEQTKSEVSSDTLKHKKFEFNVMPFISYNRSLKFMFGAIPMVMYKLDSEDKVSPQSLSGISGVYTTNGSYFVSVFNRWYYDEDRWRAKFFAVTGDYNSQFFVSDADEAAFYDYGTKLTMASVGVQRMIVKHLYGGLTYTYAHYDTKYEDEIQPESITQTNGLELNALYDSRDEVYYPMNGTKTQIRYIAFPTWFGNDVDANKVLTEYNRYFNVRGGKDVIAARYFGQFGLGNIAFQQQVTISGKDIRGYSEGKYRGDGKIALQGEYRYNFGKKNGCSGLCRTGYHLWL